MPTGQVRGILRAAATNLGKRIPSNGRTASEMLTVQQLDLRPDPSVNMKLKLSLCNKGKGRANPENSERYTFIDDAKVVSLEKTLLQRTRIASGTKWALAVGTGSQSSLALRAAQAVQTACSGLLVTAQIKALTTGTWCKKH